MEKVERLLQKRREELKKSLKNFQVNGRENLRESTGELSLLDNHPADLNEETPSRSVDLGLQDSLNREMEEVKRALEKIRDHSYGFCDVCGREIKKQRLEALPQATLCLPCEEKREEESRDHPGGENVLSLGKSKFRVGDGESVWEDLRLHGTSQSPMDSGETNSE